jgi:glucan phosphoethanolaminetransferase (alkaline phosphatase superfamily)
MDRPDKNWVYRDIIKAGHSILKHISFEYHVSVKLKIFLNSLILVLPALVQYLFFEEPEYLVSFVMCFSFVFSAFLLTRARLILTLPFVIISFVYTVFLVIYKKSLGATSIMALMNTKTEVMFNFTISPKMIPQIILFIVVFILYLRFIILKGKDDDKEEILSKKNRFIPITLLIASSVFFYFGYPLMVKAYPFSLSYDSSTYVKILSQMKKTTDTRYHFDGRLQTGFRGTRSTFILIVGESSRRADWSLYGYKRDTNAFLKKEIEAQPENFTLFGNYIATGQTTYPALMSIFSVIPSKDFLEIPKHPSFVRILKNTGYKTYFLSTYGNIFENFINTDEDIITKAPDDADLIPVLKKMLDDKKDYKTLIVMHLKGSHFAFSEYKYTYKDYIFPSANGVKDKYDNSILHTDEFLAEIAKVVFDAKYPIGVWYISDHGETLNDFDDGNYGHGCSGFTRYEIELPSLMFFNKSFLESNHKIKEVNENKNIMISHSNVSHTIMGLLGVYPREYKGKYDLSSPNFKYEEPYLIDVDLFPIRYSKAEIQ